MAMGALTLICFVLFFFCNTVQCFPEKDSGPQTDSKYTGNGKTPSYWRNQAKDELQRYINLQKTMKVAKNVIFFLGDGMSIPTVTAARIRQGQLENKLGEENILSWEKFPHVALSKTYNQDKQVPDSAGTGTQYLCGIKTNTGVLGVDASVRYKDCASMTEKSKVTSILDWSIAKGKAVGIVTTTRVTHATPGALYANTPNRNWEVDWQLENVTQKENCRDIAKQLIEDYKDKIKVIMGGGRKWFLPNNAVDPDKSVGVNSKNGRRDRRNLIEEWIADKKTRNVNHKYVWNATEFETVDPKETEYLLGLFNSDHMSFDLDRHNSTIPEPSIKEMAEKAIRILRQHDNDKGFFLLVEGGKIDWAHHYGLADVALSETIAMADAVAVADKLTSDQDTLIIVTADHAHTMSMAGYPDRGNPILGVVKSYGNVVLAADNLPYTTLIYADGPGAHQPRRNLTGVATDEKDFHQPAAVKLDMETHGGDDVAIYARGPMSHLFQGVHEQHYIAHVMAYASCVGEYSKKEDCAESLVNHPSPKQTNFDPSNNAKQLSISLFLVFGMLCFILK